MYRVHLHTSYTQNLYNFSTSQKGKTMKLLTVAAGTLLLLGLSTTAYAKCGGGGMTGMQGDFQTQKTQMLKNLGEMRNCVETAKTRADLKDCRMQMMQKRKAMMQNKGTAAAGKSAQCGTGKCGGGK